MKIKYHKVFKKHFKKRVATNPKLVKKFQKRLELLISDPQNPILKDHRLIGSLKEYRSFAVTGDVRVVYKIKRNVIYLYDIGSHNQVY